MTKKRQPPFSDDENRGTLALYFAMLDSSIAGRHYEKAASVRIAIGEPKPGDEAKAVQPVAGYAGTLKIRNKQSAEFKLMNATACHRALDPNAETMHTRGYVELTSYQASLLDAMRTALGARGNEQWAHRA